MKKHVVLFEVREGTDKGPDGYRPDTLPMVRSLEARGWSAEVIFYTDEQRDSIYEKVADTADAYISRINPGNLKEEAMYFDMLRRLSDKGVIGMAHPDVMINYGAKDALVKLRNTPLVPADTYAYYNVQELQEQFPKSLAAGERVLKQNRGSTGEGIWRVQLLDTEAVDETGKVRPDARIRCTEAKDNHTEEHTLGGFLEFCTQYVTGANGMLVDMRFLPRIKEGEIRIFMIHDKPVNVVHKKPADSADAFSATLFSGAQYRYDSPEEWSDLVQSFLAALPAVTAQLGGYDLPLIWTADFILDWDEQGQDVYILGEMNCSCVGFTSQLSLSENIADEIIAIVSRKEAAVS
ncbi:Cj0069 family protein [Ectobacillus ponti]|uniref:Cj0069 family protein n=1 Tax=Ectobacillus ponti TaxID=2961894 RepID=A0AA41X7P9_9BACI|nr:Cj0069 family protein [Ectobacillus ponti]MCP8970439.1 Cj0069 family protein [Ectobacillus ponti]